MKLHHLVPATVVLGASVLAQDALRSKLHPITSPIRHAGVFHVATGTWTRGSSLANLSGPDTIYNNTCSGVYFGALIDGEKWQHRSRVPSPTGPAYDSQFYPGANSTHEYDARPGCKTSYLINGFEFAYCSSKPSGAGTFTYAHQFASSYTACGASDMVPEVTIAVTGLPGGTSTGAQICWVVDVDLDATSASFVLLADGDGTYDPPYPDQHTFGWSFGPTAGVSGSDLTGPIIAGNYTWTGGPHMVHEPCTGTDGTIWDFPVDLSEPGTGMSSQNFMRITGTNTAPSGSGCYFFLGSPHIDCYLKLFSDAGCPSPEMEPFCFPGQNGVITCPCNNPPVPPGSGCNNFGAGPAFSADLTSSGLPSIATDSAVLHVVGENIGSTTIFLQGPSSSSTGIAFGAGVRCIAGNLKRLYTGPSSGSNGAISRPGTADARLHLRSAQLGDPLSPGSVRYYMTYYRDPFSTGPCSNAATTFNCSNSGKLVWQP